MKPHWCFITLLHVVTVLTSIAQASEDPQWLQLGIDKPEPGDRFEYYISVDLHISLLEGGISEEIQAHPEHYQACYSGGPRAVCRLLKGDASEARVVDTSEIKERDEYSEAYMQFLREAVRNLPPDTRVSAEGALAGVEVREIESEVVNDSHDSNSNMNRHSSNNSGSNENGDRIGSGVGVIRTWLSHVSEPLVALGPTDAVFVWKDPYFAELELRRRLDAHPAAAAKAVTAATLSPNDNPNGGGQAFSGLDAVLWSGDVTNETIAERARLLFHLAICLRQQVVNLATSSESCNAAVGCQKSGSDENNGGGSKSSNLDQINDGGHGWAGVLQRGRFELMMAAIEALSVARELGHAEAGGELEALRRQISGEDVDTEGSYSWSGIPRDGESKKATDLDSNKTTAQLLEDVALITISNAGYSDYTLNAMASLRIHCRLPCVLQVVCLDIACLSKLNNSFEARHCAEPTIHLAASLFAPATSQSATSSSAEVDASNGHLSAFATYNSESFNAIVRYKFEVISYFLARKRAVVFTDGDIVFLRRSFLQEAVAPLGSWRGGNGGASVEILAQCDVGHSAQRCDWQQRRYASSLLCSGFMAILSTPDTRSLFDPALVFTDVKYLASFEDQMYLNLVVSKSLPGRIDTLPRREFPNGAFRAGPHFNITHARMVHFNYNIGHAKATQMDEAGLWFVDSTTGDTRGDHQYKRTTS